MISNSKNHINKNKSSKGSRKILLSEFFHQGGRGAEGEATRIFKPVLLMTNNTLFHLFGTSTKISVEGTFTIAPSYWKQVVILQVCKKGKTVNFAFVQFVSIVKCLLKLEPKQVQSDFLT